MNPKDEIASFFSHFSFEDDIEESERDRDLARMGYTASDASGLADYSIDKLETEVLEYERAQTPPFISVRQAVDEMKELAKQPLIETPFPTLNETMTHGYPGLVSGQSYSVVSQTGRGKTPFVGAIARHVAEQGHDAVICFYEANAGYAVARMAAPIIGASSNAVIREIDRYEDDVIAKVPERIHLLNRPPLNTIGYATQWLADKRGQAPVLIIDYAQKLGDQIQADQRRPDARLAMSEASSALLELADLTKCTVIAVQSTSRMNGRRMKDVRKMAPFELVDVAKESGAIEYDAAGMIVLTLSDDYDGDERIATMTIAKARYGIECHVDMRFDAARGAWRDLGRVEAEPDNEAVEVVRAALEKHGPQDSPTAIVKLCKGVQRKKLFAAIKEMTTETFEIVRNEDGNLELA